MDALVGMAIAGAVAVLAGIGAWWYYRAEAADARPARAPADAQESDEDWAPAAVDETADPGSPRGRALVRELYALAVDARGTASAPPADTAAAPANPVLFEALRAWRAEQAAAQNVPAYCIFSQKALYALAAAAPKTESELAGIHGIGPKKLAQYGETLLDLVRQNA